METFNNINILYSQSQKNINFDNWIKTKSPAIINGGYYGVSDIYCFGHQNNLKKNVKMYNSKQYIV